MIYKIAGAILAEVRERLHETHPRLKNSSQQNSPRFKKATRSPRLSSLIS